MIWVWILIGFVRGGREYSRSVVLDGEKTETAKGSSG